MKKIVFCIFFSILAVSLFAQDHIDAMLSKTDIESFIAHAEEIDHEVRNNYVAQIEALNNQLGTEIDATMMNRIMALKVPSEVDAMFAKYGFGKNGYKKFVILSMGFVRVFLESFKDMGLELDGDNEALMQATSRIHPDDLKLISENMSALMDL